MSEQDRRLPGADFIRATACAIVLLHHLAQRVDVQSELGRNWLVQVFNSVGGFGVGMFFVLSGFLLARPFWQSVDEGGPLPSLRNYALRRGARILPGYWLALTVTFICSFAVFGFAADGWLWLRYVAGILLVSDWHWTTLFPVEINGPLWSISFEVTSYLLLPLGFWALVMASRGRLSGWPARLAWLALIGTAIGAHWLFQNLVEVDPAQKGWQYGLQGGAKTWMPWFNPFAFFAMFATGALAGGVQVMLARFRNLLFDMVGLAALLAVASMIWTAGMAGGGEFYGWMRVPYEFPLFHLLVGLVLAATPSSLLLRQAIDNRLVAYLARISFGIYVWHYLVLDLVRVLWVPEIGQGSMADPVKFLIAGGVIIAITMAIATLSYRWIEAPIIGWARQFEDHRAEPPGRAAMA